MCLLHLKSYQYQNAQSKKIVWLFKNSHIEQHDTRVFHKDVISLMQR